MIHKQKLWDNFLIMRNSGLLKLDNISHVTTLKGLTSFVQERRTPKCAGQRRIGKSSKPAHKNNGGYSKLMEIVVVIFSDTINSDDRQFYTFIFSTHEKIILYLPAGLHTK